MQSCSSFIQLNDSDNSMILLQSHPQALKRAIACSVFFYTLNKTLPDDRHLKGRIDNGMISLRHLCFLQSSTDRRTDDLLSYSLKAITYYPFGDSNNAFAVCSVAELIVGGKTIKLFGILNTWLKIK